MGSGSNSSENNEPARVLSDKLLVLVLSETVLVLSKTVLVLSETVLVLSKTVLVLETYTEVARHDF